MYVLIGQGQLLDILLNYDTVHFFEARILEVVEGLRSSTALIYSLEVF
ncbi:hypothetical protein MALU111345_09175 [Marinicrinis lubricantis]